MKNLLIYCSLSENTNNNHVYKHIYRVVILRHKGKYFKDPDDYWYFRQIDFTNIKYIYKADFSKNNNTVKMLVEKDNYCKDIHPFINPKQNLYPLKFRLEGYYVICIDNDLYYKIKHNIIN